MPILGYLSKMGCSNGHPIHSHTPMDNRLPFSKAEIEDIKAFWDAVKRRFEDTAMEYMIRFFRMNPQFQVVFPSLKELQDEQEMLNSIEFETLSVTIFSIYDDVIEYMNKDIDGVISKLEEVARMHAQIDGFQSGFFQCMEDPFIEAFREKLWERFQDREEMLMRRLFRWISGIMTLEVEAIEYQLVPGD